MTKITKKSVINIINIINRTSTQEKKFQVANFVVIKLMMNYHISPLSKDIDKIGNLLTNEEYDLLDAYFQAKIHLNCLTDFIKDDFPTMEELKKIKNMVELIK
jgi:hypothetical protein